jgi:hypothetical protein
VVTVEKVTEPLGQGSIIVNEKVTELKRPFKIAPVSIIVYIPALLGSKVVIVYFLLTSEKAMKLESGFVVDKVNGPQLPLLSVNEAKFITKSAVPIV